MEFSNMTIIHFILKLGLKNTTQIIIIIVYSLNDISNIYLIFNIKKNVLFQQYYL